MEGKRVSSTLLVWTFVLLGLGQRKRRPRRKRQPARLFVLAFVALTLAPLDLRDHRGMDHVHGASHNSDGPVHHHEDQGDPDDDCSSKHV